MVQTTLVQWQLTRDLTNKIAHSHHSRTRDRTASQPSNKWKWESNRVTNRQTNTVGSSGAHDIPMVTGQVFLPLNQPDCSPFLQRYEVNTLAFKHIVILKE